MERAKTIYGKYKQTGKQRDNKTEKRDRKFKLIIKNKNAKLKLKNTYLKVTVDGKTDIYGVLNISKLYVNNSIDLSIKYCYQISKYIDIFFIDGNDNIVGRYKRYQ